MVRASELVKHKSRVLDFVFTDGHAVRAKLLTVDTDTPEEIVYDIQAVLVQGPLDPESVRAGVVAAADPAQLASYRVAE